MLFLRFLTSARNTMNNKIEKILLYAIGRGNEKVKSRIQGKKIRFIYECFR
jgi:hypothetical protein